MSSETKRGNHFNSFINANSGLLGCSSVLTCTGAVGWRSGEGRRKREVQGVRLAPVYGITHQWKIHQLLEHWKLTQSLSCTWEMLLLR